MSCTQLASQTIYVDTSKLPFVFTPNWPSNLKEYNVVSTTSNVRLTINSTTGVVKVKSMTNNNKANGIFTAQPISGSGCYNLKVIIMPKASASSSASGSMISNASTSSSAYGLITPSGTNKNIGGLGNPQVATAKAKDTSMNWAG
jgi:hypothetical protein